MEKPSQSLGRKPYGIRDINLANIYSIFRHGGIMSVFEVSKKIGLSKTTVAKLIRILANQGILVSCGKGVSAKEGGKHPEVFCINKNFTYVCSIMLAPENIYCSIYDFSIQELSFVNITLSRDADYTHVLSFMSAAFQQALEDVHMESSDLSAISIACDGIVDSENGVICSAVHHTWGHNLPIRKDFTNLTNVSCPVLIENAIQCISYAELSVQNIYSTDRLLTIYAGIAAGGYTYDLNNSIFEGHKIELGHIIINPSSKIRCACGNYGCFEKLVSSMQILPYAEKEYNDSWNSILNKEILNHQLSLNSIFNASNQGDLYAQYILDPVILAFAQLIHNLCLIENYHKIIIQGEYAFAGAYFLDNLKKHLLEFNNIQLYNMPEITYSALSYHIQEEQYFLLGGAYIAADESFL